MSRMERRNRSHHQHNRELTLPCNPVILLLIALIGCSLINTFILQIDELDIFLGVLFIICIIWGCYKKSPIPIINGMKDILKGDAKIPKLLFLSGAIVSLYISYKYQISTWIWLIGLLILGGAICQFSTVLNASVDRYIYLVAIAISVIDVLTLGNQMVGLPLLATIIISVASYKAFTGKGQETFNKLRFWWIGLLWFTVLFNGSASVAIVATIIALLMGSSSNYRPSNVVNFPGRRANTEEHGQRGEFPPSEDGVLLSFHPKIPYLWVPNPVRNITVEKDGDRIEIFDHRFLHGCPSADLATVGDVDFTSTPSLAIFFHGYVNIEVVKWSKKEEIKFCVSKKFGKELVRDIQHYVDWTCSERGIGRRRPS